MNVDTLLFPLHQVFKVVASVQATFMEASLATGIVLPKINTSDIARRK